MEVKKCDDSLGGIEYKSDCFGVVSITNMSGHADLFHSDLKHMNYISLKISKAYLKRSHHNDYIFDDSRPYIEVLMSNAQFAEMITTQNTGCGTPCTIHRLDGKKVEFERVPDKMEMYNSERGDWFDEHYKRLDEVEEDIKETLSSGKPIGKKKQEELLKDILRMKSHMKGYERFSKECFQEEMEKQIADAKSEVKAFHDSVITKSGLNVINELLEN